MKKPKTMRQISCKLWSWHQLAVSFAMQQQMWNGKISVDNDEYQVTLYRVSDNSGVEAWHLWTKTWFPWLSESTWNWITVLNKCRQSTDECSLYFLHFYYNLCRVGNADSYRMWKTCSKPVRYIGRRHCSGKTEEIVVNQETIGNCRYSWKIMGNGEWKLCL